MVGLLRDVHRGRIVFRQLCWINRLLHSAVEVLGCHGGKARTLYVTGATARFLRGQWYSEYCDGYSHLALTNSDAMAASHHPGM